MAFEDSAFRLLKPDWRHVMQLNIELPTAFDRATSQHFQEGYWFAYTGGAVALGSTTAGTKLTARHVGPIWTASRRGDVWQSGKVNIFKGHGFVETNKFNSTQTFTAEEELTVETDAQGRGILAEAASGDMIYALVFEPNDASQGLLVEILPTPYIKA